MAGVTWGCCRRAVSCRYNRRSGRITKSCKSPARGQLSSTALTSHLNCSTEDQLEDQANERDVYVPIQIDIDVETFKIRDSFVWNINGSLAPPAFAVLSHQPPG